MIFNCLKPAGYNVVLGGRGALTTRRGFKDSAETIEKKRNAQTGKTKSSETRRKISQKAKGRERTDKEAHIERSRKQWLGDNNPQRKNPKRGEQNASAKLTESDVIDIRWLHSQGVKKITLQREYDVTWPTITSVVNRTSWTHI